MYCQWQKKTEIKYSILRFFVTNLWYTNCIIPLSFNITSGYFRQSQRKIDTNRKHLTHAYFQTLVKLHFINYWCEPTYKIFIIVYYCSIKADKSNQNLCRRQFKYLILLSFYLILLSFKSQILLTWWSLFSAVQCPEQWIHIRP